MKPTGRLSDGFSMIELIIFIAILGIVTSIGFSSYLNSMRAAQVREAASLLSADIRDIRSLAQQKSQDMILEWQGTNGYKFGVVGGTLTERKFGNNITFECLVEECTTTKIQFNAPYGELNGAVGKVFKITSPHKNIKSIEVRVVGVTGKPMIVQGD